jgi:hypothetical protein
MNILSSCVIVIVLNASSAAAAAYGGGINKREQHQVKLYSSSDLHLAGEQQHEVCSLPTRVRRCCLQRFTKRQPALMLINSPHPDRVFKNPGLTHLK